jgi:hypothetical protein
MFRRFVLVATLPEQLRQPRDVDGDRSRLVVREHRCLSGFMLGLSTVEIRARLPGGVTDNIAAGHLVGALSLGDRDDYVADGQRNNQSSLRPSADLGGAMASHIWEPHVGHIATGIRPSLSLWEARDIC